MLRPFPSQLRIGTDIQSVTRITRVIAAAPFEVDTSSPEVTRFTRFCRKLLNFRESAHFREKFPGEQSSWSETKFRAAALHLTGRWAAKESVVKAVRSRPLTFMDIEIRARSGEQDRPEVYAVILDRPCVNLRVAGRYLKIQRDDASPDSLSTALAAESESDESVARAPMTAEWKAAQAYWHQVGYDEDVPGQIAQISISHDGDYATAVCLAADEPLLGDVGGELAARLP